MEPMGATLIFKMAEKEFEEIKSVEVKYLLDIPDEIVVSKFYNSVEYKDNLYKELKKLMADKYDISKIPIKFKVQPPESITQEWYKVASEYFFHTLRIYDLLGVKYPMLILNNALLDLVKQQKEIKNRKGGLELSSRTLEKIIHSHNTAINNENLYDRIFLAKKKLKTEQAYRVTNITNY